MKAAGRVRIVPDFFDRWFGRKPKPEPSREIEQLVKASAVPSVRLATSDSPSRSHFGGSPQLPAGVAWPENHGKKLGFLARLSLADIRSAHEVDWLPRTGALLFFYDVIKTPWGFDPKDRGSWSVLLVPDLVDPVATTDSGPDESCFPIPHRSVSFRKTEAFPTSAHALFEARSLSAEACDAYDELTHELMGDGPLHQVSGFARPVQDDDMELQCQLVSHGLYCGDATGYEDARAEELEPGATHWKLLLQFDSDDDLGVMWGDCGMLYFWVEAEAARAGRFENVWVVLQCH